MRVIRKFVGRGAIAVTIGALLALAVAVQGSAARSTPSSAAASAHSSVAQSTIVSTHYTLVAAPSAACTSAINALKAALVQDKAEDAAENKLNAVDSETGSDATEDANEKAALKPYFTAAASACGSTFEQHEFPPANATPACIAAWNSLKAVFAQDQAEDSAELANGTEGTAADQSEDQDEMAQRVAKFNDVKAACGTIFKTATTSHTTGSWFDWRRH